MTGGIRPDGGQLVGVLGDVGLPGLGEPVRVVLARDQTLVDELSQRRIHGSGADPPGVVGPFGDGLDQAVAVVGVLRQQRQDGEPDVTAAGAGARSEAAETAADTAAETGAACGEAGREGRTESAVARAEAGRAVIVVLHLELLTCGSL